MSVFLQDVFGPMPTDWLFPDRSRLAKVVESWVKEGGGVAALRRSPPRSATGRRRLPRRRRGSSRTEKRRGARRRPRTMYVRTSLTERVGACLPLLAGASCCRLRRALCAGLLGAGVPRLNVVLSAGPHANGETESCSCCCRLRRAARAAMLTDSSGRASVHCSSPSKQLSSYTSSTVS